MSISNSTNIFLVGINKKVYTTKKIISELQKQKINYTFIKWGDLYFEGSKIKSLKTKLDLTSFNASIIDIPSYTIVRKRNQNKRIPIKLSHELNILLKELQKRNILTLNLQFMLNYPYYNKFTQAYIFSKFNIPSISTIHLTDNKYEKIQKVLKNNNFNYPLVVKESNGGMGNGVWKLNNFFELKKFFRKTRNRNFIIQQYLKNAGDYRVLVCGNKVLGIMKRIAQKGEWKNNFSLGGKIENYEDANMKKFAQDICKKLDLEYAGLDLFKIHNRYFVIEINIFASFEGFEATYPAINVSQEIINFLKNKQTF